MGIMSSLNYPNAIFMKSLIAYANNILTLETASSRCGVESSNSVN